MSDTYCRNFKENHFQDQPIKGKDFSNRDIRGKNFANADLRGANFTNAKAGQPKSLVILLLGIAFLFSALSGAALQIGISPLLKPNIKPITILITLILMLIFFTINVFRGILISALTSISLTIFVIVVAAVVGAFTMGTVAAEVITGALIGIIEIFVSSLGILVISISGTVAIILVGNLTILGVVVCAISGTVIIGIKQEISKVTSTTTTALAIIATLIGIYLAIRALAGERAYLFIPLIAVAISSVGGTNFRGADLTDADFTQAMLKSTDLRDAVLIRTRWFQAQKLEFSRVGEAYLRNAQIRELVTKGVGRDINFDRKDLRGINLEGAKLEYASFIDTDLSQANLHKANLFEAKLIQTNLDKSNLSGAILTGAYIQDWGITRTTLLDGVECKYVYLRLPTEDDRDPNRMPPSEQGYFEENDFNIFITSVLDTLDLYHKQNINPGIAITVLKGLTKDYPVQFELVGLEKRGNDQFLIKIKVFGQTSHFQLQREYYARYEQILPLYDPKKIMPDTDALVAKTIEAVKQHPGTRIENLHNEGIVVTGGTLSMVNQSSNQGSNFNFSGVTDSNISGIAGGDISGVAGQNMTGVAGGDISGNVTNSIGQLQESEAPEAPKLAELLKQLQAAIEADTELTPKSREKALKQVKTLAEAAQNPEEEENQDLADTAITMLKGTIAGLPSAAALAEACNKLLPAIASLLGLA